MSQQVDTQWILRKLQSTTAKPRLRSDQAWTYGEAVLSHSLEGMLYASAHAGTMELHHSVGLQRSPLGIFLPRFFQEYSYSRAYTSLALSSSHCFCPHPSHLAGAGVPLVTKIAQKTS